MTIKQNFSFEEDRGETVESDFSDGELMDLEFTLSKRELKELKEAFELMEGNDYKISFFELFNALQKKCGIEKNQPLMYGILKRVCNYKEVKDDKRINFPTFLNCLKRAMKLKNTKQQASLVFNMFDEDKSGFINPSNVKSVANMSGTRMTLEEAHETVAKFSTKKEKNISLATFV